MQVVLALARTGLPVGGTGWNQNGVWSLADVRY
jgi:hypothetical protein